MLDVAYVGNNTHHQNAAYNLNMLPQGFGSARKAEISSVSIGSAASSLRGLFFS